MHNSTHNSQQLHGFSNSRTLGAGGGSKAGEGTTVKDPSSAWPLAKLRARRLPRAAISGDRDEALGGQLGVDRPLAGGASEGEGGTAAVSRTVLHERPPPLPWPPLLAPLARLVLLVDR